MADLNDDLPLTIERLKSIVGADLYAAACKEALSLSPGTGSMTHWQAHRDDWIAVGQVLQAVDYHTWTVPDAEILRFFFELYREMPAYKVLFELSITRPYQVLTPELKRAYWEFIGEMLGSTDAAFADPVAYILWTDFFEDPDLVEKAWSALISGSPNDRLLERLLIKSGPIPVPLKRGLYKRLISDVRWHYFIYRSLLHSQFDVYGRIDKDEARETLDKLRLNLPSDEQEHYQQLVAALG